jgi:hypothetical protein
MSDETKTMSVPKAGKLYYDLGKNASYEAAKRGDIPTIKVGRKIRAVVSALDRKLAEAGRLPFGRSALAPSAGAAGGASSVASPG